MTIMYTITKFQLIIIYRRKIGQHCFILLIELKHASNKIGLQIRIFENSLNTIFFQKCHKSNLSVYLLDKFKSDQELRDSSDVSSIGLQSYLDNF